MEYTFWLDQKEDWISKVTQFSTKYLSQGNLEKLKADLQQDFSCIQEDQGQQDWVYQYILEHKLVRRQFIKLNLFNPLD